MEKSWQSLALLIVGLIVGLAAGYAASNMPQTQAPSTQQGTATGTTTTVAPTGKGEEYTVKLAYKGGLGLYLVDSKGMTLYVFAKDYNGTSSCYGACAEKWPPFYVENLKVSPGLDPNDFGVITRKDGTKQITYKGWPLYYFHKDAKPGDINGDGVKGVWFAAKPDYTVLIAVKPGLGAYLVDEKGMTLYILSEDQPGNSTCYGMCAQNWPPFTPRSLVIPSTLDPADFSFIKRSDGTTQLAYKGHPLYYWIHDETRGDTTGHGVKNEWFVASVEMGG